MSIASEIIEFLEQIAEEIPTSEFRFHNIKFFPSMLRQAEAHSPECKECQQLLGNLHQEHAKLKQDTNRAQLALTILIPLKDKLETHLKKRHGLKLPGYYISLYLVVAAILSALIGSVLNWVLFGEWLGGLAYFILALGLIAGRILGGRKDKKEQVQNKFL